MPKRPKFQRSSHGISQGKICDWPEDADPPEKVAERVKYTGHTIHKTYPSPAGPPAYRADEAKCDQYEKHDWPKLGEALREAIRAKCTGEFRGDFPSRAWAWINDVLHEARLTGQGQGDYHGFPLDDRRQYPEPTELLEKAPHVRIP